MAFFPQNFMLQNPHEDPHQSSPTLNSMLSSCTPQEFHGVTTFLGKRSMSFSGIDPRREETAGGGEDESSDDGSHMGEKKRRLSMEQVKTLEKNFELGNKLEPERKMQLARALGLQPRQIAIWFQNRRARWKTKQLEKDYDILKRQYEAIKADNDALQSQNQKLQAEIMALKNREPTESINLNKETEVSCSNRSDNSSDVKLDISRTPTIESPISAHPTTSSPFFPSSMRTNGMAQQLFISSSKPDLECPKIDHMVKEENFTNMFCAIEDQSGFWPWLEQQQYN